MKIEYQLWVEWMARSHNDKRDGWVLEGFFSSITEIDRYLKRHLLDESVRQTKIVEVHTWSD